MNSMVACLIRTVFADSLGMTAADDHDDPAAPDHTAPPVDGCQRSRRRYRQHDEVVTIESIDTVDMTGEQRATAVATLAALIDHWQQGRSRESDFRDTAA